MNTSGFKNVEAWQHAHQLVLSVYRYSEHFPKHELFGLSSQLRRAAVSVPANIAEGFRKRGNPDKVRFYNIAQGSLEECHYYFILAQDLGYGDTSDLLRQYETTARLLNAYIQGVLRAK
jgi:four helix bundle protein